MLLVITDKEKQGLKETFKHFGRKKNVEEVFYDLCFCICAPQTKFINNRKVIDILIDKEFYYIDIAKSELEEICKPVRFYRNKAKYLLEGKSKFQDILYQIYKWEDYEELLSSQKLREWLVKNVKGLGMKTASHFMRNLGDKDLAIIDTHIIKFLNTLTPNDGKQFFETQGGDWVITFGTPRTNKHYLEMEMIFQDIAKQNKLSSAELDALIWQRYSKTPWENFKY